MSDLKIGDKVVLNDGRGPFTVRWIASLYKSKKIWLEEINGIFDSRHVQKENPDDTE